MDPIEPGDLVLDVGAVLRDGDIGPFEVVAEASATMLHLRRPGAGCGTEFTVPVADLVPADPAIEAELCRLSAAELETRQVRAQAAQAADRRRIEDIAREIRDDPSPRPIPFAPGQTSLGWGALDDRWTDRPERPAEGQSGPS